MACCCINRFAIINYPCQEKITERLVNDISWKVHNELMFDQIESHKDNPCTRRRIKFIFVCDSTLHFTRLTFELRSEYHLTNYEIIC